MLERYAEKSLAKMFPRPLPLFDDYLWRKQPQILRYKNRDCWGLFNSIVNDDFFKCTRVET